MKTRITSTGLAVMFALTMPKVAAQNLVPNGSFEQFTTNCYWPLLYPELENWRSLDCGNVPGIVHSCVTWNGMSMGVPALGIPLDGEGFVSMITLQVHSEGAVPDGNPQQYANVDLVEPLQAGQRYCLQLGINRSDVSNYSTGAFHAFFWYGVPTLCNYQDTAWDSYAQVTFDISQVDTADWTILEGEFIANGGENNLTLGAFQTYDEIDSVFINDWPPDYPETANYYIDDVQLWACQVGVEEKGPVAKIDVFPNPASDRIQLRSSVPMHNAIVQVRTLDGRVVRSKFVNGTNADFNIAELAAGCYTILLNDLNGVRVIAFSLVH